MKKKIYFRPNIQLGTISLFILIDNGKIREFDGFNMLNLMLTGMQPKFETFKMNSCFELNKLSKYDKKQIQTKANYQIISKELDSYLAQDTFIKLNPFERFMISYSRKEDVFHKMNLTPNLDINTY